MADLKQVTYCGLYCGLCAECNRIPKQAADLRQSMQKEGWHHWGTGIPQFPEFWQFLESLVESEGRASCRDGPCGPPHCEIRDCARSRGVDICVYCDEYPCERIERLAEAYVNLLADGKRMREIGLDRWVEEQEARRATGFAYTDIRCHPAGTQES